jgi:hypothetical protein
MVFEIIGEITESKPSQLAPQFERLHGCASNTAKDGGEKSRVLR